MAEYDPAAVMDYATALELENGDEPQLDHQAEDEDDDYDPSLGFGDEDAAQETQTPEAPAQAKAEFQPADPAKPRTMAGFEMDDDDDSDLEDQQESAAAPQSHMNGTEGAQISEAVAPTTAAAEEIPLASEPSQEDTAAVLSATAQQSAPVNGSSSLVVPTSSFDDASDPAPADLQSHPPQDSVSPISAPVVQSSTTEAGKHQAQAVHSATISAIESATATPQPTNAAIAPPAQATESVSQTPTTQRLPHDKVGQLEDRVKEDPKADTNAWRSLIQHYREKGQLDNARKVYERFLEVFPTSASIWTEYAAMELSQENLQAAESIFHRTLLKIPSIELWKQYLDYLRRIHPLIPDPDGSKRAIISQAFDILLDNVGIDPNSGDLWREYVEFIKSMPGVIGGQGWQDAQKADLLRKAYQRAVRFPHSELTKLWKEYDNFEIGLNKQNARKFLQEHSPHYMTARGARTQLDQQINGLDRKSLPILPPLYGCYGEDAFATQVEKWRAWVEWEKKDELVLQNEDIDAFRKRILFVYRQATIFLRFYPEIWFEASVWCMEQGTEEMVKQGEDFLNNGIEACPESVLLTLRKADRVEGGLEPGSTDEIAVRNGDLLDPIYEGLLKALYALHKKLVERMNKSVGEIRQYFASLPPEDDDAMNGQEDREDDDDSQTEKPLSRTQKMEEQVKAIRIAALEQQDTLKRTISYVWVAKLRVFRRTQGQGQPGKAKKGFRGVFAEARPRGQLTSEVYIANALMEWRCYQDKSADKIFERGLKLFPIDEIFALEYIKHLISNNDDTNARAVFETTMTKISNTPTISEQQKKEKSRPLLGYMHSFESNYGDLDKIHKIERRLRDIFPLEPDVSRFASRFALPSFDALAVQLVISPTQARPKTGIAASEPGVMALPSIEEPGRSPPDPSRLELGPHGPYVASPKRPLDDSDNDSPARKFMRAESPLKGAAGRRIQSQVGGPAPPSSSGGGVAGGFVTKTYVPGQPGPPPSGGSQVAPHPAALPWEIHLLLNNLPSARHYTQHLFDPAKMLGLLNGVNLANARI